VEEGQVRRKSWVEYLPSLVLKYFSSLFLEKEGEEGRISHVCFDEKKEEKVKKEKESGEERRSEEEGVKGIFFFVFVCGLSFSQR